MSPPPVAAALLAATSPPSDYESIAGDLHEEYVRRRRSQGAGSANRWYWSQVLLSVPSLLSYSRSHRSARGNIFTALIVIAVLVAMLLAVEPINMVLRRVFGGPSPLWALFTLCWFNAAVFGGILAAIVRAGGMRLTLSAGVLLVLLFVVPTLLGLSSRLPIHEWVVLFGAVPAMCAGAGVYQVLRRHFD